MHNLYLEGAGWDDKNMYLCEPLPFKSTTKLPVIHFIPVEGKRKLRGLQTLTFDFEPNINRLNFTYIFLFLDVYSCPVYYCPKRSNVLENNSFVVVLNLNSGSQNPDHWIKRATAVLLNLGN